MRLKLRHFLPPNYELEYQNSSIQLYINTIIKQIGLGSSCHIQLQLKLIEAAFLFVKQS